MNGMDVKKVKLREGLTWNTIIYNFEKKKNLDSILQNHKGILIYTCV